MYCKNCKTQLPENAKFCTVCGMKCNTVTNAQKPIKNTISVSAVNGNESVFTRPAFKWGVCAAAGLLLDLIIMAILSFLFTGYKDYLNGQAPYSLPSVAAFRIILLIVFSAWIFWIARIPLQDKFKNSTYGLCAAVIASVTAAFVLSYLIVRGSFSYITDSISVPVNSIFSSSAIAVKSSSLSITPVFFITSAAAAVLFYFSLEKAGRLKKMTPGSNEH